MRVIGITGGIGCGKSEVLRYLEGQGEYVIEADKLAHRLMKKGENVYCRIVERFGKGILDIDGEIDRTAFSKVVFNDDKSLSDLNAIVHPAVREYILNDIRVQKEKNTNNYFIEAALLIQDGYKDICDEIWYIYSDKEIRLDRLVKGRGFDRSKYELIMDKQDNDDYYRDNCDVVIDNSGNIIDTLNVVKVLLNKS